MSNEHNPKSDSAPIADNNSDIALHGATFFPHAQSFVVSGGTFTSVTNINHTSPSKFRMIPVEDIDLLRETCVINSSFWPNSVKRIYSARIIRKKSPMTVALPRGDDADEDWFREISKYSGFRHPNFMQLYGAASSYGLRATIFHDDLIPLEHFVAAYRQHLPLWHLPLWTMYINVCADKLMTNIVRTFELCYPAEKYAVSHEIWLRSATGRLCLDFSILSQLEESFSYLPLLDHLPDSTPWGTACFFEPQPESMILASSTLDDCHWACGVDLAHEHRFSISAPDSIVRLGVVVDSTLRGVPPFVELAVMTSHNIRFFDFPLRKIGTVLEDGWTRIVSSNVGDFEIPIATNCTWPWISQANHIFSRLHITSHHEQYVLLTWVVYSFHFERTQEKPPKGYLFICPSVDFQVGPSAFRWPVCPVYWSCDELGEERLGAEDAERRGFPAISFSTEVIGNSWDQSVYAALQQFHQGKGFDPDSQDVARHIGRPLFQVSSELDAPFAHADDEVPGADECVSNIISGANTEAKGGYEILDQPGRQNVKPSSILDDESRPLPAGYKVVIVAKFALILLNIFLAALTVL
ncbi:hypothetical protein B0H16DRAFT_1595902 [Mycena metata]|uniref:Protein kinase domain-containing protein n=1 Tax=Mycena metata TaxID=1033252 RepID=A0AAD7MMV2_9AGAR|nr:hypothetical protein B0H16DRAFT_1595902 [Mycena metata]